VAWRLARFVACKKTVIATAAAIAHAVRKAGVEIVSGMGLARYRVFSAALLRASASGERHMLWPGSSPDVATKKQKAQAAAAGKGVPGKPKPKKKTSRGK